MGQCYSSRDGTEWRPRSRRGNLSLKQNQVYHLNHVECQPYQGRRPRYLTHSSFLGLVPRQTSTGCSVASTSQSSMVGSNLVLHQDSLANSSPVPYWDALQEGSKTTSLRYYRPDSHQTSQKHVTTNHLLQQDTPHVEYRRGGTKRAFRSHLDYQAVRQSYLLAMSQESLLESDSALSTHSLSTEPSSSSPFHTIYTCSFFL